MFEIVGKIVALQNHRVLDEFSLKFRRHFDENVVEISIFFEATKEARQSDRAQSQNI